MTQYAFLTGSPRSGTTILEEILNCHPQISALYEPYYLWEKHFSIEKDDRFSFDDLTEEICLEIRKEYGRFAKLSKKPIVLDKLPIHVFNIPVVQKIFPEAKWIHIYRDGRDVTLSIQKEWNERKEQVNQKNYKNLIRVFRRMLGYQPFWSFRTKAIWHELSNIKSLNPNSYLNKSRWKGKIGWGPRFVGWLEYLRSHNELEFSAKQWQECMTAVFSHWGGLPDENKLEVQYEALLQDTSNELNKIFSLLGLLLEDNFVKNTPTLKTTNFNKWETAFDSSEKKKIGPIITDTLIRLGYAKDHSWYE